MNNVPIIRVASVQSNVAFGKPAANAEFALNWLPELAADNVKIAVFPEAYLTGYAVDDRDAAEKIAISFDPLDPNLASIDNLVQTLDMVAVVGFAEKYQGTLYNSAAIFESGKAPRVYRKTHLPELGLDKHVSAGSELSIFDTKFGTLGVLICFDMRAPEAARSLALQGADVIVLPTNWPVGAEVSAEHICVARAAENKVYFITCNRVGTENGFTFIGKSKIISPTGIVLECAGREPTTLITDIELDHSRDKQNVVIPGKYETAIFESRRPDLYSEIVKPKAS